MTTKNVSLAHEAPALRRRIDVADPKSAKGIALFAFVFLGLIWGSNFIFMKWAAAEISPAQIVLLRVVFAFPTVFLYALWQRALRWQHVRYAHHFIVMSLLATAIYYFAFAKGAALLPSSIAGLLSGAIPLFAFICTYLFLRDEIITLTKAAGVALGLLGVVLIARPWSAVGYVGMEGIAYMMVGSFSLGCSFAFMLASSSAPCSFLSRR
ncbi:DMT family transporter [Bradyrhizobium vignae]|uniref:DMT family transporter n=1 Tax=Bradyrhizobium vignae TaxID=1549949 RepID=UPI001ABFF902|nr:DMT family transporter [Bradyrhizobium vignae]